MAKKHKGLTADIASVFASGKMVKDWCILYHWPKQRGYSFNRYTEEGAYELALEFVRKSNFMVAAMVDDKLTNGYIYSQALLDSYVPSDRFISWSQTVPVESAEFKEGDIFFIWSLECDLSSSWHYNGEK